VGDIGTDECAYSGVEAGGLWQSHSKNDHPLTMVDTRQCLLPELRFGWGSMERAVLYVTGIQKRGVGFNVLFCAMRSEPSVLEIQLRKEIDLTQVAVNAI
jgi:hypothetical protein